MLQWARFNIELLREHNIVMTATTGQLLSKHLGLPITLLKSSPLGGDQQIGARVADGEVDFMIFFWDPLEPRPDVKALLPVAVVWNIPVAFNHATTDFVISSPLMGTAYQRILPNN